MKGADHLVPFAAELHSMGVPFTLDIFGDGNLAESMGQEIKKRGLEQVVRMRGNLKFTQELLPELKRNIDLFVACHRQGDPSCTYLETFGCGVPIIGYDNEAFSGLLERAIAGMKTPMDDLPALAQATAELLGDRPRLARMARAARRFAEANTCELSFRGRTDHLLRVARELPSG